MSPTTSLTIDLTESFPLLARAPIVEAVVELRARAQAEWKESILREQLAARLPEYPELAAQREMHFEATISSEGSYEQPRRDAWRGVRATSADKLHIAQFNRDGFALSRLEPYQDWDQFQGEALRLWQIHADLAKPTEVQRLGVRFINRIAMPVEGKKLREVLTGPPQCPQVQALEQLKDSYQRRTGRSFPVTFAKYTGETSDTARDAMRQHPPQIMLTNYVMAELMLVRPEDQRFLDRVGGGLRFLIFDELHTYRGRQGADVAMLIRRLKERCAAPGLVHVGTSATMVANRNATPQQRREAVAEFATRLFGHPFTDQHVVEETLVSFTARPAPSRDELAAALAGPTPTNLEQFRHHPLAGWVEAEFGVEAEEGGRLKRRVPQTLAAAAIRLAEASGISAGTCEERLRDILNRGGELVRDDGGRAFAFKLHQFIGQGRALFVTLEPSNRRDFSLEGQVQAGGGRLFAPVKFCRHCGQDYYHVLRSDRRFLPHPVGVEMGEDGIQPGYLMLAPAENDWTEGLIPEEWRDTRGRLTRTWRDRVPVPVWVAPDGSYWSQPHEGAIKMWWQAPFSLCLNLF